jgi:hypothetical protein
VDSVSAMNLLPHSALSCGREVGLKTSINKEIAKVPASLNSYIWIIK